ncbi:diguanylate cyclase [Lacrimispora defluvii]|uniref:GGDEF domain-containing protein n=1 Tax=Lacrimispora defluvii TaxID=2719233 RepID=A0ABX1VQ46_9FIRM|nr:GGDEF domain-containing protein [Lacrimispora defluvii]NNJ30580.1 GGDEF domain-containing protein [Lacrimispora defluvii]
MIQFIIFAIIYGIMMFIWSFVFLNKSNDKVNQSFLYFISLIILWMVLSLCSSYSNSSVFVLALKTVYWISMMNLAVAFLLFVYRLLQKRLDAAFYISVSINTLTILARYLFPIDYSDPTFWRLSLPVVAPIMATVFTLPAVYALFLITRNYCSTKDQRQKVQLKYIFLGVGLACLTSVISEYILPAKFHLDIGLSFMYVAILIFIACIFVSIMKYKLLNMRSEYIYRKVLLSSSDGIILVNKNRRIICVNDAAKGILRNDDIGTGDYIAEYIPGYAYEPNYKQHEVNIHTADGEVCLSITQYPIEPEDRNSAKLITITDVTSMKQKIDLLVEQSSTDPMTGFYNKQYFIEQYCNSPEHTDTELSLLFVDIDDFKSINDLYGHIVGDKVLEALAACVRKSIRSDSKAVRFGGDEFIILLENTSADDAYHVAERIRVNVNNLDISRYVPDMQLSLSIGVANSLMLGMNSVSSLIKKADTAMYRSKRDGKNQVTIITE